MAKPQQRRMLGSGIRYDYYVDSNRGSDLNSGRSPAQAFATFAPLTAIGALGGKRIGIEGGTRLALSRMLITGNNIVIGTYGSGTPLLDCRAVLSGFTKTTGRTSVYEKPITLPGNAKILGNAWADELMMLQVTSLALCDSTPGSCYVGVAGWASASTTLYLHPPASSTTGDPDTDGKVYRYSKISNAIDVTGDNTQITNVRAIGNAHQDGSIALYGRNCVITNVRCDDGARHNILAAGGAKFIGCGFSRGRNDLEAGQFANSLVVNQTDITQESYETYDLATDAADTGFFTGPFGHDATLGHKFLRETHLRPRFSNMPKCWDVCSSDTKVINAIFSNCRAGGYAGLTGSMLTVSGATGDLQIFYEAQAASTIISSGNRLTCSILGSSTGGGFFRVNSSSGDVAFSSTNDVLTIASGPSLNSALVWHQRGSVTITGLNLSPGLCAPIDHVVYGGGALGGTITYTGTNNVWPLGAKWAINGTTYPNLAAVQAAGYEAGSSYQPFPTALFSDNFNRADEFLDVSAGWARAGATANVGGVRSNAFAALATTPRTLYYSTTFFTSSRQWLKFKIAATGAAGPVAVLRAADADNWIGVTFDLTSFYVYKCVAGTITGPISGGTFTSPTNAPVPAVGQEVVFAVIGNVGWLYVDGWCLGRAITIDAALAGNVRAGIITRSSIRNPWIDDFSFGTIQ